MWKLLFETPISTGDFTHNLAPHTEVNWYGDYFGDLEFDRMAAGSRAALLPDQSSATRYAFTIRSSASRAER